MATCDMCGSNTQLYNCVVEGATLRVCSNCSKFGEVKSIYREEKEIEHQTFRLQRKHVEEEFEVVDNFSMIIKGLREKQSLKQEELALKISEKESLIHGLENGHISPSFDVAKKLEKYFGVTLIEKVEGGANPRLDLKSDNLTIGDLIKIRKSKNKPE